MLKIFTSVLGLFPSPLGGKHGLSDPLKSLASLVISKWPSRPCLPPLGLGNKPLTLVKIFLIPKR